MGTIDRDPALFGQPERVTWNTPVALAFTVADFFAAKHISWLDPCANEGSILTPDVSILLANQTRRDAYQLGVSKGMMVADAEPDTFIMGQARYILADGLALDWDALAGGVYVNPPYGSRGDSGATPWIKKAAACKKADVIMLLPARTETKVFQERLFPTCDAICFWRGRFKFLGAEAPAPFPSVLVYWGADARSFKEHFNSYGRVIIQP